MRSLDPRVRYVWVTQALLTAAVLGAIVGGIAYAVERLLWPGVVVFALFGLVSVLLAVARYRIWRYQVRTDSLFLDRGVFTRVRTVVPYVRIQHVDANRGPVERGAGLATVVVYTAGSRGADVTIPGLTPEDAEELQERLKRLAIVAEGEDAV
ncbi:PH domain-containing protein [Halomarina oriensis]|uniref:PH domain-containing protein n=1 Tax=Halomarina oriensis TaxID=671145 RepID=A0A6B0GGK3_9EURY|nr:PH domain-containing protein [Halomarina oriensis]MWG33972.1 PH domain-containing protein [Halomarina oriensis]